MDIENRETARNLFTLMTMLLDRGASAAIDGQSPHLTTKACRRAGEQLKQTAQHLSVLSEAALYLSRDVG